LLEEGIKLELLATVHGIDGITLLLDGFLELILRRI
jgi:hypothetical protein